MVERAMISRVFEYVTTNNGVVHLTYQHLIQQGVMVTICGRVIGDWVFGDETLGGFRATCPVCQQIRKDGI